MMIERNIKTVIVTGPTGAVGTALCSRLLQAGCTVVAVCRPGSPRAVALPKDANLYVVACDAANLADLPQCMAAAGLPMQADLVFDVRFLPNPFYIPGLGRHTGLDADVRDFVLNHPVTQEFMTKMQSLLTFLIPHYQEEGKHRLSIAIGCTGGAHRSVAICEALAAFLREQGYAISVTHRDLELEQAHWKERPEVQ